MSYTKGGSERGERTQRYPRRAPAVDGICSDYRYDHEVRQALPPPGIEVHIAMLDIVLDCPSLARDCTWGGLTAHVGIVCHDALCDGAHGGSLVPRHLLSDERAIPRHCIGESTMDD